MSISQHVSTWACVSTCQYVGTCLSMSVRGHVSQHVSTWTRVSTCQYVGRCLNMSVRVLKQILAVNTHNTVTINIFTCITILVDGRPNIVVHLRTVS